MAWLLLSGRTMRPVGVGILVLLGACVPHAGVGEFEAGLSVCAKGPVTNGMDVSHYDGTIAWPSAKAGGIEFAIMKATEGTTFVDPTFATNWQDAGKARVIRGAYHFFRPAIDAVAQADFFVKKGGCPLAGDLPLAIDLEATDDLAGAQVGAGALAFLKRVEQTSGRKPLIYTSARFMTELGNPAGFDGYTLWVANWEVSCPKVPAPAWSDWTFWQHSSTGMVPGISAAVDLDQFNGTLAELQMFVAGPK